MKLNFNIVIKIIKIPFDGRHFKFSKKLIKLNYQKIKKNLVLILEAFSYRSYTSLVLMKFIKKKYKTPVSNYLWKTESNTLQC